MARIGCWLSLLLMAFAFVALFGLVVIPVLPFGENNPTLMQIKGALLCAPGQTYVMEGQNFSDFRGSGRRFDVYCVAEDGTKVNVIEKDFLVSAALFAVPFVIGLLLGIFALSARVNRRARQFIQGVQVSEDGVVRVGGMQFRVQKGSMNTPSGSTSDWLNSPQMAQTGQGAADLTGKLQQLKEAYTKGLITQDEYEKMRQRILDESV